MLCEETNESRLGSAQVGALDSSQRLAIASRLAAITEFCNRYAIWTGTESDGGMGEDISGDALHQLPIWNPCARYHHVHPRPIVSDCHCVTDVLDPRSASRRNKPGKNSPLRLVNGCSTRAHDLMGYSFQEIAEQTGVSVNTLLSRKRYSVQHLRRRLQTIYDEFLKP